MKKEKKNIEAEGCLLDPFPNCIRGKESEKEWEDGTKKKTIGTKPFKTLTLATVTRKKWSMGTSKSDLTEIAFKKMSKKQTNWIAIPITSILQHANEDVKTSIQNILSMCRFLSKD